MTLDIRAITRHLHMREADFTHKAGADVVVASQVVREHQHRNGVVVFHQNLEARSRDNHSLQPSRSTVVHAR